MEPHKQTRLVLDFIFHLVHSRCFLMGKELITWSLTDHNITVTLFRLLFMLVSPPLSCVTNLWMSPRAPDVTAHWHHSVTLSQAMRQMRRMVKCVTSGNWDLTDSDGHSIDENVGEKGARVRNICYWLLELSGAHSLTSPSSDTAITRLIYRSKITVDHKIKHCRNLANYPRSSGDTHNYLVCQNQ